MTALRGGLLALLVFGGMAFALNYAWQDNDAKAKQISDLTAAAELREQVIAAQFTAIESQAALADAVTQVQADSAETRAVLRRQNSDLAALKKQMRDQDAQFNAWLRAGLPAGVGLLYARPETTDPTAYRKGAGVPPGGVPSSGPSGAGGG